MGAGGSTTYKGPTKRVVIIGGGVGGSFAAQALQKQANIEVTLLSATEYLNWAPATLRALVEPDWANQLTIPHAGYLTTGKLVLGRATRVTDTTIDYTSADGSEQSLPYDYVLFAMGSGYAAGPAAVFKSCDPALAAPTIQNRLDEFKAENAKLAAASSVCIVGAGATGIELAGEICGARPDIHLTLITRSNIADMMPAKVQRQIASHFAKFANVKLLPNTTYDPAVHTADVTYTTVGMRPSTECLKDGPFAQCLAPSGHLICDPLRTFAVTNGPHDRAFAVGDITSPGHCPVPFQSAYFTFQHSLKICENIIRHASGQKMKPVGMGKAVAVFSLGKKNASGALGKTTLPQGMMARAKSKDLFTAHYQKQLGGRNWAPTATFDPASGTFK